MQDYDCEEDERGVNHISGNKCRTCGRVDCEGGAACELAAEMRNV
jgi:hypothetical protein